MTCPSREDLVAVLDGALPADALATARTHVARCAGCRAELSRLEAGVALLRAGSPAPEPSPLFAERLAARLAAESPPQLRFAEQRSSGDESPPQVRVAEQRSSGDEPPPQVRVAEQRSSGDEPPPQVRVAERTRSGDATSRWRGVLGTLFGTPWRLAAAGAVAAALVAAIAGGLRVQRARSADELAIAERLDLLEDLEVVASVGDVDGPDDVAVIAALDAGPREGRP